MGLDRDWRHEAHFENHPSSISGARGFVSRRLADHRLDRYGDDLRLVVSELATNSLVHGQTGFVVVVKAVHDSLRLEVHDGTRSLPVLVSARALDTSGRGIAIVDALSHDWGVSVQASGGKSVWAEFDLRAAEAGSSDPSRARTA